MFGLKLFKADSIDDLTLEQYNVLVELWNLKNTRTNEPQHSNNYTTKIVTVQGRKGVEYGDD